MDSDSETETRLISQPTSDTTDSEPELEWVSGPDAVRGSITAQLISHGLNNSMHSDSDLESKLISLISQLTHLPGAVDYSSKLTSLVTQIISLVRSVDLDSQPKPESEFMSLTTQITSSLSSSISELVQFIYLITQKFTFGYSELESDSELMSLIHQLFSLVFYMNSKSGKLISLSPQVLVRMDDKKFGVIEVPSYSNDKWHCLPWNWERFSLTGEEAIYFLCRGCKGKNHKEYNKASVAIKHPLHRKHLLQLVLWTYKYGTRKCYCCEEDLIEVFYHCSSCDFSINIACAEKPPFLSVDHPKWHEHTLALFPRQTSLTCELCALADSGCPFYICPPCDFVVHKSCINLPHVIRISRHAHRISFTPSFDQRDWSCGVCRIKVDNEYGGYSCIKDCCSYAVHSRCATQRNVWDGIELEGEPDEMEQVLEPFVTISDGIIQHFSHLHHHLRLDENAGREYDENKQCQACIMPIYFGNFYSCIECDFILHEACANFPRKIHHPIHPHMITLVVAYDSAMDKSDHLCSACPWLCTAGFFYECSEEGCVFKLHVQCGTISEPLVHESHIDPLFLTSKPGDQRKCCVCKELIRCRTTETFNCIVCDFALCFMCATLPQKVRYKHDKHMLTLSHGEETSTMMYWCEVCEGKIDLEKQFYMCGESCCVTLHIECLLGRQMYMKPGSSWFHKGVKLDVLPNNHHMTRHICSFCEKRCLQNVVFLWNGLIMCSLSCIYRKHSE